MANIAENVKEAGTTVLTLGKKFLLPMFIGLAVIGTIVAFVPKAKKFLM